MSQTFMSCLNQFTPLVLLKGYNSLNPLLKLSWMMATYIGINKTKLNIYPFICWALVTSAYHHSDLSSACYRRLRWLPSIGEAVVYDD